MMDENERFRLKKRYSVWYFLRDNVLNMEIPVRSIKYLKLLNHYENRISDLEKQISILKQERIEND